MLRLNYICMIVYIILKYILAQTEAAPTDKDSFVRYSPIGIDQFLNFAEKKAEFANLFGLSREEKQNRQNGTVHNNNDIKKIK